MSLSNGCVLHMATFLLFPQENEQCPGSHILGLCSVPQTAKIWLISFGNSMYHLSLDGVYHTGQDRK